MSLSRRRLFTMLAGATLPACAGPVLGQYGDPLQIVLLPVRQGEAMLVRSPDGRKHILIGCGGPGDGGIVERELKKRGVTELEALVIASWTDRHVGDGIQLLNKLPIGRVLHNPVYAETERNRRFYLRARELEKAQRFIVTSPSPGEEITLSFSPPCLLTVVAPTGPMLSRYDKDPECAMMLEFRYDKASVLYLGNSRVKHQRSMWGSARHKPVGNVLLLSGAGSQEALDFSLLKPLGAREAVIMQPMSAPQPRTLVHGLQRAGLRVSRTDEIRGGMEVRLEPDRYLVRPLNSRAR